mgnify:CR=1 FL=1
MRCLFAGTPAVALPALQALLESQHEVIGVITRPPAPAGRGRVLTESPVEMRARAAGLAVLTPRRLADPEVISEITELAPDVCPVVAYGGLVPTPLLAVPAHGWVNLHFSVLPAFRGAAPVPWAIRSGERETGASVFRIDEGLDTGPVLGQLRTPIGDRDTAGDLLDRLAALGADLLVEALDAMAAGTSIAVPQPTNGASLAPRLTATDARVDWHAPGEVIDRLVRAMSPAPGAWTVVAGSGPEDVRRITIGPVTPLAGYSLEPGVVMRVDDEVRVGTSGSAVLLGNVRPAGKRFMPAADWLRGRPSGAEPVRFA